MKIEIGDEAAHKLVVSALLEYLMSNIETIETLSTAADLPKYKQTDLEHAKKAKRDLVRVLNHFIPYHEFDAIIAPLVPNYRSMLKGRGHG